VTGDAKFDLSDTRKPAYAVKAVIDSVKADALLSAWTPAKNLLAGTLNTKLDFSGAGQSPNDLKQSLTLVGLASLADGRVDPFQTGEDVTAVERAQRAIELRGRAFEIERRAHRSDRADAGVGRLGRIAQGDVSAERIAEQVDALVQTPPDDLVLTVALPSLALAQAAQGRPDE